MLGEILGARRACDTANLEGSAGQPAHVEAMQSTSSTRS